MFLSTRRLWINSVHCQLIQQFVTKLRFIRIKTELVYIGRRRTTSFNENDTRVNKTANIIHLTKEETEIPKGCHFDGPPCIDTWLVAWWAHNISTVANIYELNSVQTNNTITQSVINAYKWHMSILITEMLSVEDGSPIQVLTGSDVDQLDRNQQEIGWQNAHNYLNIE